LPGRMEKTLSPQRLRGSATIYKTERWSSLDGYITSEYRYYKLWYQTQVYQQLANRYNLNRPDWTPRRVMTGFKRVAQSPNGRVVTGLSPMRSLNNQEGGDSEIALDSFDGASTE
jgi:hypothetical protein